MLDLAICLVASSFIQPLKILNIKFFQFQDICVFSVFWETGQRAGSAAYAPTLACQRGLRTVKVNLTPRVFPNGTPDFLPLPAKFTFTPKSDPSSD